MNNRCTLKLQLGLLGDERRNRSERGAGRGRTRRPGHEEDRGDRGQIHPAPPQAHKPPGPRRTSEPAQRILLLLIFV